MRTDADPRKITKTRKIEKHEIQRFQFQAFGHFVVS